ncbi:MAG TPA: ATP-binding protein [Nevskiaceae bacterium]|nr:ATP-binding protein [Nevskiaceae bacterium]
MSSGESSIRGKLTALSVLSSAAGLLLAAAALIIYAWVTVRAGYQRDLQTVAHIVADNSTAALVFGDRRAASETLAALRAKPEIQLACIYDGGGSAFGSYAAGSVQACPPRPETPGIYRDTEALTLVDEVRLKGERVGLLRLTQTLQPLRDTLENQVAITLSIMAVSFFLSLSIAWLMQRGISGPIVDLAQTARRVSESRDYSLRAGGSGSRDEVGLLVEAFNQMLGQIAQRDGQLRQARDELAQEVGEKTQANTELQAALLRLREAQAQLVQSEKLASLGALVAGVAHEINTPIGIGVTASSTLQARAAQVTQKYKDETLKRSDLEGFIATADESTRIILKNLQRAADLIHSFKQVAVDQTSGERRRFGLKSYIDEVLLSLGPRLKATGHSVLVDCPGDLVLDSYPGALAQILTNFVSNSLMHAFDTGVDGRMEISVRESQGMVELRYADNGRGMPPADLARIFDPFFTTKRGAGGSGLGMHVVYNLVTQLLKGQISVASEPGHGVEFLLRFPVESAKGAT